MYYCKNIKDFTLIAQLKKLKILNLIHTNISDISFLEKNNNIKILYLFECKYINANDNIFNRKDIDIHF